jgi:hypothetical protein
MKYAALTTTFVLALAACRFGLRPTDVDGGDDAGGGEMDASVIDQGMGDLAGADALPPDLHRPPPDGVAPGTTGWPCDNAFECASGYCIDGFCCEEFCDPTDPNNLCKACNVPGFEGRCVLALDGTDPRGHCDGEPESSCGRDGLCDGAGKCRKWNAGTLCAPPMCASGTVTTAKACDGLGNCILGTTYACTPPSCANATSCETSCGGSGTCGNGQACSSNGQCLSSRCIGGVCCATECTGPCKACNLPWAPGICTNVPDGIDPNGDCASTSRATCGGDGQCDGAGGCRLWPASTPCAGPSCSGDDTMSARVCDGLGTCLPGITGDCQDYSCNPALGVCYRSCASDAQCAQGLRCKMNGKCQ